MKIWERAVVFSVCLALRGYSVSLFSIYFKLRGVLVLDTLRVNFTFSIDERHHSSLLPAYCDPPNPCPKGYTKQASKNNFILCQSRVIKSVNDSLGWEVKTYEQAYEAKDP